MSLRSACRENRALTARRASHQPPSHACSIVERYTLLSASVDLSTVSPVGAILNALHYKIVMQVAHAGKFAPGPLIGRPPMVVSDFEGLSKSPRQEMTSDYIRELVSAFGEAARRANAAGFDGAQIHSAHGYLLSQFLSPAFMVPRLESCVTTRADRQ